MSKENAQESNESPKPLFGLGQVVITPGAADFCIQRELNAAEFVTRHVTGDFGDMDPEDLEANRNAVKYGDRVFSSYTMEKGGKLWVITEWDRSATTILLPSEY